MEDTDKGQEKGGYFQRPITRRQAIKAGGLVALGVAFTRPTIETFRPGPAFASGYPSPTIGDCCPGALPLGDEIIAEKSYTIPYFGEVSLKIRGPKPGTSCCDAFITFSVMVTTVDSAFLCDIIRHLVDDGKIKVDTDGVDMPVAFEDLGARCRLTSDIHLPVECVKGAGCSCAFSSEARATTVRIPIWSILELKLMTEWSATVTPGSGPCEVGGSTGFIPTCFHTYTFTW